MISRRDLLRSLGYASLAAGAPSLSFAATGSDSRFVLVVLRGAVDGLAVAAPYGDGNYADVRGELALPAPGSSEGALKLDGLFGLHPALASVYDAYQDGDAAIVHAVASPYRARSHFDGQDLLESGASAVGATRDGWLNRALTPLARTHRGDLAIALAQNTPLVLRGDNAVGGWAPSRLPDADDSTLRRLQALYADDEFFATRLDQALRSQDIADGMGGMGTAKRGNDAKQFAELMKSAGRFLSAADGPDIAVVELGGWDTHANQGASNGALSNRLSALDDGLSALRSELGDFWGSTVITVVTEFGRTVRVNGTRGTDHGTGTAAMLIGGAVEGGRVIADWPGLRAADLYADRDLMPTTDLRSVFKAVLRDHLGIAGAELDRRIFPGSESVAAIDGLIAT